MNPSDIQAVLQWWLVILVLGTGFLPLSFLLFKNFFDKGYIFSKILSLALISYTVFLLGILRILPFGQIASWLVFFTLATLIFTLCKSKISFFSILKKNWRIFLFEELLFLASLFFWSTIRSFNPEIHGLEKYMDYGFINSILRADYFPPKDMWFTPLPINYYYFGHLITAVLTKLSSIPANLTYNLMLSTVFALCLTQAFSIGGALFAFVQKSEKFSSIKLFASGLLTALLVTFSGNLHMLYAFFKPYEGENPVPLWELAFSPLTFPNSYWYPNATRFIHNTIHEFPIYSWIVADLHGHVLDIPLVLLTIAVLLSFFMKSEIRNPKPETNSNLQNTKSKNVLSLRHLNFDIVSNFDIRYSNLLLIGFLLAVMYMTNAWDGGIYFLLTLLVLLSLFYKNPKVLFSSTLAVVISFALFSYPYNYFFVPFASGVGILCAPEFLTNIGRFGPFLFENNFCQHSLWWQLLILYGFFYFFAFSFLIFAARSQRLFKSDIFILLLITLSTFLIILPEFIYLKDIYPAHYRANTMFKLVFQAFIMLSISSGYIITRLTSNIKYQKSKIFNFYFVFFMFSFPLLTTIMIYPFLATDSYYNVFQKEQSKIQKDLRLDGTAYLKELYPDDYNAIEWINKNIKGQPVILEAQGDSYTDYARVSSNTGLPTILGWTVHEWLWRGSYDVPSPRIEEVRTIYETSDIKTAEDLLKKYNVKYVFVGSLEYQKYTSLDENKFESLGKTVYQSGATKIYELNL
jgi:uncharacterized membrane protein